MYTQAPIVGGFLAEPAAKYHNFDNEFFCTYPFVLPAFISVGLYIVGFIGIVHDILDTSGIKC